jgi:pimeloyl-ACP methyl ester carboxylesterase
MKKMKYKALTIALIIGLIITTLPIFIASSNAATNDWTLTQDGRGVKAYSDLKEYVWQKNASMAPNGLYDKIGLHRLIKTGVALKGVVFMIPGIYGNGEKLVSNPLSDNFTKTENMSQCTYWANRGFDVYTIDYRYHFIPVNFNKSQLSFTANWGMDQFISDIKEAVDKAKEVSGNQKVFMAGMSWGGILAQIYAAKYWQQDLRGLVLLDPGPPKSTVAKNQNQTNSYNLTSTVNTMKALGGWLWENPQASTTPSPLNPGYVFLVQFAAQNPGAPAQYLNGTLVTTINPRTNQIWANITEWFEYGWNTANSFNTYGGYSNVTVIMNLATTADRYYPLRIFLDYTAMLDWTVCPYMPYDYVAHVKEINVPVIAFRSGLNLAAYGNITNGMATTDFTWTVLPNYGHSDVFQGTYSARDVSQPALDWMLSHYQSPVALASSQTPYVISGQTSTVTASASGGLPPYTYQWYEGASALPGQTSTQLTLTKTTPGTYNYYCSIIDAENTTTASNAVTLSVALPPILTPAPTATPSPSIAQTPTPTVTPPTTTPTTTPAPTQSPIPQPSTAFPPEATYAILALVAIIIVASATLLIRKRRK